MFLLMGSSVLITIAAITASPLVVKEVPVVLFPTGQNVNAATVLGKVFLYNVWQHLEFKTKKQQFYFLVSSNIWFK